jgi:hypothetical protein
MLLPEANRDVLAILLECIAHMARFAEDTTEQKGNQMTGKNLAVVFAPNLFFYKACLSPLSATRSVLTSGSCAGEQGWKRVAQVSGDAEADAGMPQYYD